MQMAVRLEQIQSELEAALIDTITFTGILCSTDGPLSRMVLTVVAFKPHEAFIKPCLAGDAVNDRLQREMDVVTGDGSARLLDWNIRGRIGARERPTRPLVILERKRHGLARGLDFQRC